MAVAPGPPIEDRLRLALTAAMKARNPVATAALRSALAAIGNLQAADLDAAPPPQAGAIAGGVAGLGAGEVARRELSAAEAVDVVRDEIDERRAAADEFGRLGRPERTARLRAEADVLAAHVA